MGYVVPARSGAQILEIAERVRKSIHMENKDMMPPHIFVECLSVDGNILNYEVCEDIEAANIGEAFYNPSNNTIIMPDSTYANVCGGQGRARFTVAHEIGHWILKHSVAFAREWNRGMPWFTDSEWQANSFAGSLLAPPRLVRKYDDVDEIMFRFGLSRPAAEIALKNAKKVKS